MTCGLLCPPPPWPPPPPPWNPRRHRHRGIHRHRHRGIRRHHRHGIRHRRRGIHRHRHGIRHRRRGIRHRRKPGCHDIHRRSRHGSHTRRGHIHRDNRIRPGIRSRRDTISTAITVAASAPIVAPVSAATAPAPTVPGTDAKKMPLLNQFGP